MIEPQTAETLAKVHAAIRDWLAADAVAEEAWQTARRLKLEALGWLRTVGGEIDVDGVRYRAIPTRQTIQMRRIGPRKRGAR